MTAIEWVGTFVMCLATLVVLASLAAPWWAVAGLALVVFVQLVTARPGR